jgi:hypothetical protein
LGELEMLNYDEQEFIQLALERRYINMEAIEKCQEMQKQKSPKVPIGDLLRMQKLIGETEYNAVIATLKCRAAMEEKTKNKKEKEMLRDRHFAEIALREGLITQQQLIESVTFEREQEARGRTISLADALLEKGYLAKEVIDYIEEGGAPLTSKSQCAKVAQLVPKWSTKHIQPLLVVIQEGDSADKGHTFDLNKQEVTLGRVKGADIQLNDSCISRIHCKLMHTLEGEWCVVDMMSSHGVYINGNKVMQKATLQNGDQIQLGRTVLQINI